MISHQATEYFEQHFQKSLRLRMPQSAGDTLHFKPVEATGAAAAAQQSNTRLNGYNDAVTPLTARVIVLTIAALHFRLMMLLRFDDRQENQRYFVPEGSSSSYWDVLAEVSNLCSGALNQSLLRQFPDLGMSTPWLLDAACSDYLSALAPDLLRSYEVSIDTPAGGVSFTATLCLCIRGPFDDSGLRAEPPGSEAEVEEPCGEMEMF